MASPLRRVVFGDFEEVILGISTTFSPFAHAYFAESTHGVMDRLSRCTWGCLSMASIVTFVFLQIRWGRIDMREFRTSFPNEMQIRLSADFHQWNGYPSGKDYV